MQIMTQINLDQDDIIEAIQDYVRAKASISAEQEITVELSGRGDTTAKLTVGTLTTEKPAAKKTSSKPAEVKSATVTDLKPKAEQKAETTDKAGDKNVESDDADETPQEAADATIPDAPAEEPAADAAYTTGDEAAANAEETPAPKKAGSIFNFGA